MPTPADPTPVGPTPSEPEVQPTTNNPPTSEPEYRDIELVEKSFNIMAKQGIFRFAETISEVQFEDIEITILNHLDDSRFECKEDTCSIQTVDDYLILSI